jgi:hypothetical protein
MTSVGPDPNLRWDDGCGGGFLFVFTQSGESLDSALDHESLDFAQDYEFVESPIEPWPKSIRIKQEAGFMGLRNDGEDRNTLSR